MHDLEEYEIHAIQVSCSSCCRLAHTYNAYTTRVEVLRCVEVHVSARPQPDTPQKILGEAAHSNQNINPSQRTPIGVLLPLPHPSHARVPSTSRLLMTQCQSQSRPPCSPWRVRWTWPQSPSVTPSVIWTRCDDLAESYLDDFGSAQGLACIGRFIRTLTTIQFLPLFFEVVHCLLLLLSSGRCMKANEIACWVELEALRSKFRIDPNQDHT